LYTCLQPIYKPFDRAVAETVRSQPLIAGTRFNTGSVCIECMVDILAIWYVSLRVFPVSPESVAAPMLHSYISLIYHSSCIICVTDSVVK
jgi:hypothetical protein